MATRLVDGKCGAGGKGDLGLRGVVGLSFGAVEV